MLYRYVDGVSVLCYCQRLHRVLCFPVVTGGIMARHRTNKTNSVIPHCDCLIFDDSFAAGRD